MGATDAPKRKRSVGILGVMSVLMLALFLVGAGLGIAGRMRLQAARKRPLHETGPDPSGRISDAETYRLRVWGLVDEELSLTLDDVKSLPAVVRDEPLACVLGWTDYRRWRGPTLRDVVALAGPRGSFVTIRDDRDFSASLDTDYVLSGRPILAWEAGGEPLPRAHGWPLRIVAPDRWGYKWVKWVTEIEVHDRGHEGTYEEKGFSLDGDLSQPRTEAEKRGEV
jgi:DMSO/TMAO reductase YedYZ molybdopterin-dependent catalytic subunit